MPFDHLRFDITLTLQPGFVCGAVLGPSQPAEPIASARIAQLPANDRVVRTDDLVTTSASNPS